MIHCISPSRALTVTSENTAMLWLLKHNRNVPTMAPLHLPRTSHFPSNAEKNPEITSASFSLFAFPVCSLIQLIRVVFLCVGKRRRACLRKGCLYLAWHHGFLKCILPPALQTHPAAKELMKFLMTPGFLVSCFYLQLSFTLAAFGRSVPAPLPVSTACCLQSSQQGHGHGLMEIITANNSYTKFNQLQQYFQDSADISYLILSQIIATFII